MPPPAAAPPAPARPPADVVNGISLTGPAPRSVSVTPAGEAAQAAVPPAERGTAFRADFRLPVSLTTVASGFAQNAFITSPFSGVPQLAAGVQFGRFSVTGGIGFSRLGVSISNSLNTGNSVQLSEILFAPTLTFDVFESTDGKVALYLLGAPTFGMLFESNSTPGSDLGFQFALGASYALHDNFRIGLEAGPLGHFYTLPSASPSGGAMGSETDSVMSFYTALVGTFAYPR